MFFLYFSSAVYLPLTMLVDYMRNFPWLAKLIPFLGDATVYDAPVETDADVAAEEQRVLSLPEPTGLAGDANQDVIHIRNLRESGVSRNIQALLLVR